MPSNNKPRGTRGKRKEHSTHNPARPPQEQIARLQKAITKRTEHIARLDQATTKRSERNPVSDLPGQTTSASASGTDAPPADQQELIQKGVTFVSVESDSDHSLSDEGTGTSDGASFLNGPIETTTINHPTPHHTVEHKTAPDGRLIIRVSYHPDSPICQNPNSQLQRHQDFIAPWPDTIHTRFDRYIICMMSITYMCISSTTSGVHVYLSIHVYGHVSICLLPARLRSCLIYSIFSHLIKIHKIDCMKHSTMFS